MLEDIFQRYFSVSFSFRRNKKHYYVSCRYEIYETQIGIQLMFIPNIEFDIRIENENIYICI